MAKFLGSLPRSANRHSTPSSGHLKVNLALLLGVAVLSLGDLSSRALIGVRDACSKGESAQTSFVRSSSLDMLSPALTSSASSSLPIVAMVRLLYKLNPISSEFSSMHCWQ